MEKSNEENLKKARYHARLAEKAGDAIAKEQSHSERVRLNQLRSHHMGMANTYLKRANG